MKVNPNQRFSDKEILVYDYGSRVYGTATDKSDYDYIIVFLNNDGITGQEIKDDDVNIQCYNAIDFQSQLNEHKINILECYFQNKHNFKLSLNLGKLRDEISAKASNSFVKAKKKIDVEKDYYIGWKSLFHSLRIVNFGIQIASKGEIYDYSQANPYWFEILNHQWYNWQPFKDKYQSIYNGLCTEFRKLAKKD